MGLHFVVNVTAKTVTCGGKVYPGRKASVRSEECNNSKFKKCIKDGVFRIAKTKIEADAILRAAINKWPMPGEAIVESVVEVPVEIQATPVLPEPSPEVPVAPVAAEPAAAPVVEPVQESVHEEDKPVEAEVSTTAPSESAVSESVTDSEAPKNSIKKLKR